MADAQNDPVAYCEQVRAHIGRMRGWTRHGAHDRAAEALDAALRALDNAEAALRAASHVHQVSYAPAIARLRADLDAATSPPSTKNTLNIRPTLDTTPSVVRFRW